ncbi:hypothetical protein NP493_236g02004 [Ridgeia piscesae]|uniref:Uncharacterized protein n=1 Tax=Ridgeia piscesae TaxID=27915 RepID=A0AAD9NZM4_RIDPI|nr:hypothetical protein NP493_236g02004 [Ridgeia piscesae]
MDDIKCIVNIVCLLILISYISSKHRGNCSCIFDEIKLETPQKTTLRYEKDAENVAGIRSKRSESQQDQASSSLYQPIRIAIEYSDIDYELNLAEQEELKRLVENMVRKVTNIFSGKVMKFHCFDNRNCCAEYSLELQLVACWVIVYFLFQPSSLHCR